MIIRKKYNIEMGHIVRNCSSNRCSHSMHGHSAVIEVLLEGQHLDRAGMLYDFGLMKGTVKQFIDMFDHCFVFWDRDNPKYIKNIKEFSARWIALPFNPTAEMLSLFFMVAINDIIRRTVKLNGEDPGLKCTGVIYHETESGYAQCCEQDVENMWNMNNTICSLQFSEAVYEDLGNDLLTLMDNSTNKVNPSYVPHIQVIANPTGQDNDWR